MLSPTRLVPASSLFHDSTLNRGTRPTETIIKEPGSSGNALCGQRAQERGRETEEWKISASSWVSSKGAAGLRCGRCRRFGFLESKRVTVEYRRLINLPINIPGVCTSTAAH